MLKWLSVGKVRTFENFWNVLTLKKHLFGIPSHIQNLMLKCLSVGKVDTLENIWKFSPLNFFWFFSSSQFQLSTFEFSFSFFFFKNHSIMMRGSIRMQEYFLLNFNFRLMNFHFFKYVFPIIVTMRTTCKPCWVYFQVKSLFGLKIAKIGEKRILGHNLVTTNHRHLKKYAIPHFLADFNIDCLSTCEMSKIELFYISCRNKVWITWKIVFYLISIEKSEKNWTEREKIMIFPSFLDQKLKT